MYRDRLLVEGHVFDSTDARNYADKKFGVFVSYKGFNKTCLKCLLIRVITAIVEIM